MLRRLCADLLDRADYLLTLARLTVLDWVAELPPETPTDRAIREESELISAPFPQIDVDHPTPVAHVSFSAFRKASAASR